MQEQRTLPHGVIEHVSDLCTYQVSRTGVIYYPKHIPKRKIRPFQLNRMPMVLSLVDGRMAVNPLHGYISSDQSDSAAYVFLKRGKYRLAKEDEPSVAYWHPQEGCYVTYPSDSFLQNCKLPQADDLA
jgi:hypothetical protein